MLFKALYVHRDSVPALPTKQLLRVMKMTAIMLLVSCLTASAGGYGQITLSEKNAPLSRVLKKIEQQTGYEFLCPKDLAQKAGNISVEVSNAGIREVLELILTEKRLSFVISDKTIIIREAEQKKATPPPLIDIKGRVVNEKGEPVVATILVKGTQNGTTSNHEGYFELKGVDDNATLIISGVSIETAEIKLNGRTDITINALTKVTAEEEVTIRAGYYDVRQREATGNISKVTAKEIEKQPVSNPVATLQGRVPGIEVTQMTGVPGGNFKIRIRGTNSIANGNDPLYIIDGVPFMANSMSFLETSGNILGNPNPVAGQGSSPLNSINPLDIESIEVLKDADATAIYGSRGANGVILITTKKGKPGKTKVDFNYYGGAGKVARKMNMLNTRQYLDMRYEAYRNDGIDFTLPNVAANDLKVWDTTRYTDWQKELIGGTANYMDAQVTVSGGDKFTQFSLGGGYHRETTVFPGNNADRRISAHASINNTSANQKLKTSLLVNYSSNFTDLPSRDLTIRALSIPPNGPALYDAGGNLNWTGWGNQTHDENPLANLKRPYEATTNNLIANAVVSYSILPNLDVRTNLGYTNTNMRAVTITPISSLNPNVANPENTSSFSNSNFQNWIVEPQLNWRPQLGKGVLDILAGTTFLEQVNEGLAQSASGFSSEALMKNLSAAANRTLATNYYSQYRYNAVFWRINYNLDRKYIINITGRRDGSSRFGPDKQFANFGAVGAAWIFSHESFIQKALPFLSFGKLRASYGTSGNDQLGDYQYIDAYTSSGFYQSGVGLTPVRLSNPDFAWEINKKLEAAIELGFIRDRILLGVSWYRNRSSNQLVGFPLAPTTGFPSIQGNFPATVQNTGIEIEISTRNIESGNFTWSSSFNISVPSNKLVDFPNMEAFPAYANRYMVGEPLSIRKLYYFLGLNTTSGLYEFEDVDGNGSFDYRDQQSVRFVGQNFSGGLQNSIQYQGVQFDILFQFVKQTGNDAVFGIPGQYGPQPVHVLERWQKPGDNATYQKFSTTSSGSLYSQSDAIIGDASFARLKNLSLSYSLPQALLKKMHVEKASMFIQGQNLLTITDYNGLDPETQNQQILPPLKVLTVGIRLTF